MTAAAVTAGQGDKRITESSSLTAAYVWERRAPSAGTKVREDEGEA